MQPKQHSLNLNSRKSLVISAVDEVISFDENLVSVLIGETTLDISGEGLSIKNLSIDDGEVCVDGFITALVYYDNTPKKKRFGLFGR